MGQLLRSYFTPNGSYLMQDYEDGNSTVQVTSLLTVRDEIREAGAEVIVAVSPHWQPRRCFYVEDSVQHFNVNDYPLLPQPFGRRYFAFTALGDPELASGIVEAALSRGLPAEPKEYGIDHGAFTALKVLNLGLPVVPVATSGRSHSECHVWGSAIRSAIERSGRKVVALCPGNLSHRLDLRRDSEADAYGEELAQFDQAALALLESGDYGSPEESLDPRLMKLASPETGLRTFSILHGLTDGAPGEVIAYKGFKYSVGDATVRFKGVM